MIEADRKAWQPNADKPGVRMTPVDSYFTKYYYDPRKIADNCTRWGQCRWASLRHVKSKRFSKVCPSVAYYYFDSYSLQGRLFLMLALMDGRLKYEDTPELLNIVYRCNLCGGCDAMCKLWENEGEPLRAIEDFRARLVTDGQLMPAHMPAIDHLKKEDNMMMASKADRGKWAEGLKIKDLSQDRAEVLYHAGCRFSFEQDQWPVARQAVTLLKDVGVDVGIMGNAESCCAGRVYEMGYRSEYTKFAESNVEAWTRAGVKTIVTSCSDCYCTIKRRYAELGARFEVLHMVEYMERLVNEGKIKLQRPIPMSVTYHDPCHLGRRTDVYAPGKPIEGVYDPPRRLIQAIPGMQLAEMERIREYAWCCGAGCRVREDFPDFSVWTASERIEEARSTGAEAIVTACGWCERNFMDATRQGKDTMKVLDLVQLVRQSAGMDR